MNASQHADDWARYKKLNESCSNQSGVSEPNNENCFASRRKERYAWMLVVNTLIFSNILLLISIGKATQKSGTQGDTYETGFATDLLAAVPNIDLKTLEYTGGVEYHPNGTKFLNLSGSSALYVGEPTPEIEKNWEDLESSIPIILDEHETKLKNGTPVTTMHEPGQPGRFRVSIDVIHSLHCVNQLRKAVYADHYFPKSRRGEFYFTHMNHCLEHIRQAIQCHSDLTPLVYEWDEERASGSPIWTSKHTCRDFGKLLAWDKTRVGKSLLAHKNP